MLLSQSWFLNLPIFLFVRRRSFPFYSFIIFLYNNYFSVCTRMGWSLTVLFVGFLCLLGVSIPNCDDWQEKYLHLVLMLIVLSNVGVNVLQGKSTLFVPNHEPFSCPFHTIFWDVNLGWYHENLFTFFLSAESKKERIAVEFFW